MSLTSHNNSHSQGTSSSRSSQSASERIATTSRSTIKPVITAPPWAKDEPDSPDDDAATMIDRGRQSGTPTTNAAPTISDLSTTHSSSSNNNHLWSFVFPHLKRNRQFHSSSSLDLNEPAHNDNSQSSNAPSRPILPKLMNPTRRSSRISPEESTATASSPSRTGKSTLRLQLPLPPDPPFTVSHTKTPGWDSPWTPRVPTGVFNRQGDLESNTAEVRADALRTKESLENDGNQKPLRRRIRGYFLHNNSVPLVSRIINIIFTTVALAFAVKIRLVEERNHLLGAIGSSPYLAIIFAPLTLVHVMVAIYLEYFGRPLGLWRTSAKLAYTLLEVLFICAWSAELALSFDNYFTSRLNCSPPSSVSWFSELPPLPTLFGENPTSTMLETADHLCDYQRTLIGVVMVSLVFYVTNLVISLFRIFEKVKVRQGWGGGL